MLTSVFTRFRLHYPNILPDIQIANFDQILDLFEDGQLNLAFVTDNMLLRRQEGYQFHRFCRKGGFAVLPSEHPLAARDSISFSELEKQVIIRMAMPMCPSIPAIPSPGWYSCTNSATGTSTAMTTA